MKKIVIKRIYDEASDNDGYRVLVDRLWPRGISKIVAHLDEWNKELSPSTELRKWFGHKTERFDEFKTIYKKELKTKNEALDKLREIAKSKQVTLLYGAKDPKINHAVILRDYLNEKT